MVPKKLIFIAHLILILLAWTSPFWLNYKIIGVLIILNYCQIRIFKGCILTNLQFKNKIYDSNDLTMYSYCLELIGFKPNRKKVKFIARYIMPAIILTIALIWQVLIKRY